MIGLIGRNYGEPTWPTCHNSVSNALYPTKVQREIKKWSNTWLNAASTLRRSASIKEVNSTPIVKCPNCPGRLRPTTRPTISEGYFQDINGVKHATYRHYRCENCGRNFRYDIERNFMTPE